MATVVIHIVGIEELRLRTTRLEKRIADPAIAYNRIADDMMKVIRLNFTSQGRRGGGSWQGINKAWRNRKIKELKDPRILIKSGRLMNSWTIRGNRDQKLAFTPTGFTLDSDVPYGIFHQEGSGHNPKRQFISFSSTDRRRWTKMMRDDLMSAYRGGRVR